MKTRKEFAEETFHSIYSKMDDLLSEMDGDSRLYADAVEISFALDRLGWGLGLYEAEDMDGGLDQWMIEEFIEENKL